MTNKLQSRAGTGSLRTRSGSVRRGTGLALSAWLVAGVALSAAPSAAVAQAMKPEVQEHCKKSAVLVFTAASQSSRGDKKLGSGSGFFINSTGMLVTNNHVVDPMHQRSPGEKQQFNYQVGKLTWTVIVNAGTEAEKEYECEVLYQNDSADQAILQAYDENGAKLATPNYLRFLPETRLQERMRVWALGFPGGDSQKERGSAGEHPEVTVTEGFVTDLPRTPAGRLRMIITDVLVRPGNSGGATVDIDGFVVGTVTLQVPPDSPNGQPKAGLVPMNLTREFVYNAYSLGRIKEDTDFLPFIEILTNEKGRIEIPQFARLTTRDAVFFPNGDRMYGTIATDKITWESGIGTIEVPTEAIAYVMSTSDGAQLILEGGNRIAADKVGIKFMFKPDGGSETELSFDQFRAVAFRTSDRALSPVTGRVLAIDSGLSHLVLKNVEGVAAFDTSLGAIEVALSDVYRVDALPDGQQVVSMHDGRRLTGKFREDPYTATVAATGTPIKFSMSEIKNGFVDSYRVRLDLVGGLDFVAALTGADRDVQRVADAVDDGDLTKAKQHLDKLLAPDAFRRLPNDKKDQVRMLEGVIALRTGEYDAAVSAFRKCTRAGDENLAAYCTAAIEVLKKSDGNSFEGEPVSDPVVFAKAGASLATETISRISDEIRNIENREHKSHSDYTRTVSFAKQSEGPLQTAAILGGPEADDTLIRTWRTLLTVCELELRRIAQAAEDLQQGRGPQPNQPNRPGGGGRQTRGGQGAQLAAQRDLQELTEQREKVIKTYEEYQQKLGLYGFHIEDPDIRDQQDEDDEGGP